MAEEREPLGGQPSGNGDAEPGEVSYSQDTANNGGGQAPIMARMPIAARQHLTDLGNARRLVLAHGGDLRYCEPLSGWLVWDGRRWAADDTGEVERRAKGTVLEMYASAAAELDDSQRRELIRWTLLSESAQRIRAMVDLARTELGVTTRPAQFDADPWLLNVANGTLDLRTGTLREHRRGDLLTRLAPVDYDPAATHPILDRYLVDATAGDADFAAYLQRACGYTLTGLTTEECFFLMLGPGGSGKSTLVEAMLALLGDYGAKASFAAFLNTHNVGGATPELARLRGARLVAAVEAPKDRQLNEVLVKELTGGDTVTARQLYHDPVSFSPTFKLWLAANDSPKLTDTDTGLWRRLRRLPFEHELPEDKRDPAVKAAMTGEALPALLAWAVQGCAAWQRQGLGACAVVRTKTAELRAEFDPLAEFFAACCTFIKQAETPAAELRQAYEAWAASVGARPINNREWGQRLEAKGCRTLRTRRGAARVTVWCGIGLLAEDSGQDGHNKGGFAQSTANFPHEETLVKNGVCTVHPVQAANLWADLGAPEPAPGIPTGKPIRMQVSRVRIQELMDQGMSRSEAEYIALAELDAEKQQAGGGQ